MRSVVGKHFKPAHIKYHSALQRLSTVFFHLLRILFLFGRTVGVRRQENTQNCDNKKQQHLINQLRQDLIEQKQIADRYKDYADVFTLKEYSDKITELAMDAEMEEVFTEHKRWGE